MLDPKIKRFLSNIGKKGGTNTAKMYDMVSRGKRGGMKKAQNRRLKMTRNELILEKQRKERKLARELSTDKKKA